MADQRGRAYEVTTEDPVSAKTKRVKKLLSNPDHLKLSNRKLAVLARVSEKMIRLYRRRMNLPSLKPHTGRSIVILYPPKPSPARKR